VLAVAKQTGLGKESLRRWVAQAEIDAGELAGVTSEENEESSGCGLRTVDCANTWPF
jgi:hypothetical protein